MNILATATQNPTILHNIRSLFESSITGNILAVISLVITFLTFWKTVSITKTLKQEKIDLLNKSSFNQEKAELLRSLSHLESQLTTCETMDYMLAKNIFNEICHISSHDSVFNEQDRQTLSNLKNHSKDICERIRTNMTRKNYQIECLDIIHTLRTIIEKGDYGL